MKFLYKLSSSEGFVNLSHTASAGFALSLVNSDALWHILSRHYQCLCRIHGCWVWEQTPTATTAITTSHDLSNPSNLWASESLNHKAKPLRDSRYVGVGAN